MDSKPQAIKLVSVKKRARTSKFAVTVVQSVNLGPFVARELGGLLITLATKLNRRENRTSGTGSRYYNF